MTTVAARRIVVAVVALLVLGTGFAVLSRLVTVRQESGVWAWSPPAAPPKIVFGGRDYRRGGEESRLGQDLVRAGTTPGGGRIYRPAGEVGTSLVLVVADGQRLHDYVVLGGP